MRAAEEFSTYTCRLSERDEGSSLWLQRDGSRRLGPHDQADVADGQQPLECCKGALNVRGGRDRAHVQVCTLFSKIRMVRRLSQEVANNIAYRGR